MICHIKQNVSTYEKQMITGVIHEVFGFKAPNESIIPWTRKCVDSVVTACGSQICHNFLMSDKSHFRTNRG